MVVPKRTKRSREFKPAALTKTPTGIPGLDQITGGGLPRGRPTLVCGGAGSGKTLLAMEFIVKGAVEYGEPGVFMSFEETAEDLAMNVASLGYDLNDLIKRKLLVVDYVSIERGEIEETGEYDLEGLFLRINLAIDAVGAKRVALDTIESLFAALPNAGILRAELRRLFQWLKERGMTAMVTGERGEGQMTRHGLEEYVSDCVILLDHRMTEEVATRRLRIVKYRGSAHGSNEYPFLLDEEGFTVVPITAITLQYQVPTEFISTGIPELDAMLGGKGYYRGSNLMVTGGAGTGKTSLASTFANASCKRGARCLYFAFEESPEQIVRNMRSIGLDLQPWVNKGLLRYDASRPSAYGLEMHLAQMHRLVEKFQPDVVVIDPVSSFEPAGSTLEIRAMLMRLVDFLKSRGISAMFTSLTAAGAAAEQTEVGISSLIDTWLLLRNLEQGGERTRGLYILKARGMAHSNQVREFLLTDRGIKLVDVYVGAAGILTGSAKVLQEAQDMAAAEAREQDAERRRMVIENKRRTLEARLAELKGEFEAELRETEAAIAQAEREAASKLAGRTMVALQRSPGPATGHPVHPKRKDTR